MTIDEILDELGRIRDRLEQRPEGEEYAELIARRDDLRRQAREAVPTSREALVIELERLTDQWDRLQKDRIDVVKQAGGGSTGGDFAFTADAVRLNQRIDAAGGREELEKRIRELKRQLGGREQGQGSRGG